MIYMVNVFRGAKSSIDPELAPVFVGLVRLLASCFSSLIMRWASRKFLYMACMSVVALGNLAIATYSLLKSQLYLEEGYEDTSYLVIKFVDMCVDLRYECSVHETLGPIYINIVSL